MSITDQALNAIPDNLKATLKKDEYRITLFHWAVTKKIVEYMQSGNVKQAATFAAIAFQFAGRFATGPKISFSNFMDPWKPFREEARKFAKDWDLDAVFVAAMG